MRIFIITKFSIFLKIISINLRDDGSVLGMVAPCNHRPKRDFTSAKEYTMHRLPKGNLIYDIEEQQLH